VAVAVAQYQPETTPHPAFRSFFARQITPESTVLQPVSWVVYFASTRIAPINSSAMNVNILVQTEKSPAPARALRPAFAASWASAGYFPAQHPEVQPFFFP